MTCNNFIFVLLNSVYLTEQSGTRIMLACSLSRCVKTRRLTTEMGWLIHYSDYITGLATEEPGFDSRQRDVSSLLNPDQF
jgi:hypothetical protein